IPKPWLQLPTPAIEEAVVPCTAVVLPLTPRLPFEPTFPPVVLMLFGGLVGGFSVAELKLKVWAPPARLSEPHPVPVAKRPKLLLLDGVCAISCCTRRRAPATVTASEVTMYTGLAIGASAAHAGVPAGSTTSELPSQQT